MDKISVKGESYIKGSVIARELGYTADYVGQLCRSGQVECTLVGRSWYVSEKSIRAHKKNRYRSNQAKSLSAVRQMVEERVKASPSLRSESEISWFSARYEKDESPLIPLVERETEKVAVNDTVREPETEVLVDQAISIPIHKKTDEREAEIENVPVSGADGDEEGMEEFSITRVELPTPHKQIDFRPASVVAVEEGPDGRISLMVSSAIVAAGVFVLVILIGLEQRSFVSKVMPPDDYFHFDLMSGIGAAFDLIKKNP